MNEVFFSSCVWSVILITMIANISNSIWLWCERALSAVQILDLCLKMFAYTLHIWLTGRVLEYEINIRCMHDFFFVLKNCVRSVNSNHNDCKHFKHDLALVWTPSERTLNPGFVLENVACTLHIWLTGRMLEYKLNVRCMRDIFSVFCVRSVIPTTVIANISNTIWLWCERPLQIVDLCLKMLLALFIFDWQSECWNINLTLYAWHFFRLVCKISNSNHNDCKHFKHDSALVWMPLNALQILDLCLKI